MYNPSQRTQQRPWGAIFSRLGRPHDERGASAHYVRIYSYDVRRGGKAYGLPCGSGLSVQCSTAALGAPEWRWKCTQGTSPTHSLSTRRLFSYDSKTFNDSRTNMHSLQSKDMRLPPTALNAATCHLLAMRKRAEACSRTWLIAAAAQRMISLFDCSFCDDAHLCDP